MIYSQLLVSENNDDNSHTQRPDSSPNHDLFVLAVMMQPNNPNAEAQNYHNHSLSGIGTFTQCKVWDLQCFIIRC